MKPLSLLPAPIFSATALAFLLLAGIVPRALEGQTPRPAEAPIPFQMADGLYYVGTDDYASYLFTSEAGHILIDAPLEANVPLLLANFRALGFDPADIRIHLASHAHFDHVGGMAGLLEATGGELLLSEGDAEFVRSGRDFGLEGVTRGYPPATVARTIGPMETVRLGDIALTAHLTPGHTPGCTSWGGTVRIDGVPYDFISVCSLSVLSYYTLGGDDPSYTGQARDYCTTLAHLEALDPDIFLGAHAGWFNMEEKRARRAAGEATAFVERESYRAYLARARSAVEGAVAAAGFPDGCAGLTGQVGLTDE